MSHDPFTSVYEKGIAVCEPKIHTDTMVCRFKDEVFEMPTIRVHQHCFYNGYFHEIPIDKLRELEREEVARER